MTNHTANKTTKNLEGWNMACSLLVGTHKAIEKARGEYVSIRDANPGRLFIGDANVPASTLETLIGVARTLEHELHLIARSADLEMPKLR